MASGYQVQTRMDKNFKKNPWGMEFRNGGSSMKKKKISVFKFLVVCICALLLGSAIRAEAAQEKVMNVAQTKADDDSVGISWDTVDGASGYQIEYCQNAGFSGDTYGKKTVKASEQSARLSGLGAGKSYYIRIMALDEAGNAKAVSESLEVVTAPGAKVKNLLQTYEDESVLACSWERAVGANVYRLNWTAYSYATKTWSPWNTQRLEDVDIWQLPAKKDTLYCVRIYAGRRSASGYVAYAHDGEEIYLRPIPEPPAKVTNVKMLVSGVHMFWPEANVVRFGWDKCEGAEGYHYVVSAYNGKQLFSGTTTDYRNVNVKHKRLTNEQFMKIKVRGYKTVRGEKKYGEWSGDCYFAKCLRDVRFSKLSGGAVRMRWSKTKGAKNYTVYASVKQKSGYKKLGTTSKNTFRIKRVNGRKLVRGKVYFFKVTANRKVGKKTYFSDNSWYFSRIF